MPVNSGKAVGSQNVAKAGVNREIKPANIAANNTVLSARLATPGMPKLTFSVTSTQAHSIQVIPQVCFRNLGLNGLEFVSIAPTGLTSLGTPFLFEVNAPAQAIRVSVTNPNGAPGTSTGVTIVLMASG